MILKDITSELAVTQQSGKSLLDLESPKNSDYTQFEHDLNLLCKKALLGTLEFFSIDPIINNFSLNKNLIKDLLEVKDKVEFRSLCKRTLRMGN